MAYFQDIKTFACKVLCSHLVLNEQHLHIHCNTEPSKDTEFKGKADSNVRPAHRIKMKLLKHPEFLFPMSSM